jgi:hypothetical protein
MANTLFDASFLCFLSEHESDPTRAFALLQRLVADPFCNEFRCSMPDAGNEDYELSDGFGYTEEQWRSLISAIARLGVEEAHRQNLATLDQLDALTFNVAALREVNRLILSVEEQAEVPVLATSGVAAMRSEPDITSQPQPGAKPTPPTPWWALALAAVLLIGASLTFIDFDFSQPVVAKAVPIQELKMRPKRSIEEPWKLTAFREKNALDGFATVMKVTEKYPTTWEGLNKSVGSDAVDVLDPALSGHHRYAVLITPKKINQAKFRKLLAAAAKEVPASTSVETDHAWMQAVTDGLGKMGHAKIEFSIVSAQSED